MSISIPSNQMKVKTGDKRIASHFSGFIPTTKPVLKGLNPDFTLDIHNLNEVFPKYLHVFFIGLL